MGKGQLDKASGASSSIHAMATTGASKVKGIMSVIEPEQADETGAPRSKAKPKKMKAAQLKPVKRPNGEEYIPRRMEPSDKTDIEMLRENRNHGITMLLGGYPGCGKTASVEAAYGDELITIEGNGDMEISDFVGSYVPTEKAGEFIWKDGPLVRAMKEGKVLFVDDITLIAPSVLAKLYPVMDGRGQFELREHGGELVEAKEGFMIVGAHNPDAPGAILSEALASRFQMQPEVASNLSAAADIGVDRTIIRVAKNMQKRREEGTVSWAPEMRELLSYARIAEVHGPEVAVANMIQAAPIDAQDALRECLGSSFPNISGLRVGD